MPDVTATLKQLIADLERERDELRLQAHLGRAEARDYLAQAEAKLADLRRRADAGRGAAKEAAGRIEEKTKALVAESRTSFTKVRQAL
jgi:hypothetical protein